LVVKKDSKIFSRCSSAIPVPVFGHPRRHVRDVLDPADLDAHGEPTSTRHRVGGVGDQVDEDLRELIAIAQHGRIRLVQDLDGLDALGAELVRHQDQCALDHLADVHGLETLGGRRRAKSSCLTRLVIVGRLTLGQSSARTSLERPPDQAFMSASAVDSGVRQRPFRGEELGQRCASGGSGTRHRDPLP